MIGIGKRFIIATVTAAEAASGGAVTETTPVEQKVQQEPETSYVQETEQTEPATEMEKQVDEALENGTEIVIEVPATETSKTEETVTETVTEPVSQPETSQKPNQRSGSIGIGKRISNKGTAGTVTQDTNQKIVEDVLNSETSETSETESQTPEEILDVLKSDYADGSAWGATEFYECKGSGLYSGGYGCAAFAYMLSDNIYEDAAMTKTYNNKKVAAYDIVELYGNTHTAFVLSVDNNAGTITVAEGNIDGAIVWGSTYPINAISAVIKR